MGWELVAEYYDPPPGTRWAYRTDNTDTTIRHHLRFKQLVE